jgi:hypothetical protein
VLALQLRKMRLRAQPHHGDFLKGHFLYHSDKTEDTDKAGAFRVQVLCLDRGPQQRPDLRGLHVVRPKPLSVGELLAAFHVHS